MHAHKSKACLRNRFRSELTIALRQSCILTSVFCNTRSPNCRLSRADVMREMTERRSAMSSGSISVFSEDELMSISADWRLSNIYFTKVSSSQKHITSRKETRSDLSLLRCRHRRIQRKTQPKMPKLFEYTRQRGVDGMTRSSRDKRLVGVDKQLRRLLRPEDFPKSGTRRVQLNKLFDQAFGDFGGNIGI